MSKTLNETISKYCQVTLISCAYAGTGDVLKVPPLPSPQYAPPLVLPIRVGSPCHPLAPRLRPLLLLGPLPLQVQELLAMCGEHIETEESTAWKAAHQVCVCVGERRKQGGCEGLLQGEGGWGAPEGGEGWREHQGLAS